MKKILLSCLILVAAALSLSAIPAHRGWIRFAQPDGSSILLMRHGDEWGHWLTDEQGRTVTKGADGYYHPLSDIQAVTLRRRAAVQSRAMKGRRDAQTAGTHMASGQKRFLVVLVEFPDRAFTTANPQTAFSNQLNEAGYSVNGATGSVRDYYEQNSGGKFEPVFDVYGPVTVSHEMAYYGGNDENGRDKRPAEAVWEAVRLLDGQIDFSQYDNDSNGVVDLVFMYYAGYGEADSSDEDSIWPHQWNLSYGGLSLTMDGKRVDAYACSNELIGSGSRADAMVGIGTACHEFGHAVGLPDFYDTDYATNGFAAGTFNFSVMSGGNNCNDDRTPPYFSIVERIMLGWLDQSALQEIPKSGDYTLGPVQNNVAYMTPTDQEGEYFVYECRSNDGWDAYAPAHGLIVYHVDQSARKVYTAGHGNVVASELWSEWPVTNSVNENGSHPCHYIVSAADQSDLKYGYRYIESRAGYFFDPDSEGLAANIPFPGAKNETSYTAISWNGVDSSVSLSNISYSGGQVSFTATVQNPYALDYFSIKNPGNGSYMAGTSFPLALNEVANHPYTSVEWRLDGTKVTGSTVTLTAGAHTVEAVVSLQDGKRQIVTLELKVN